MPKPISKTTHLLLFTLFIWPQISNSQVIISEIMYDPSGRDEGREWVEIYNNSSNSITIPSGGNSTSWRFSDGSQHSLVLSRGSGILAPGAYAVIVDSPLRFLADQPAFSGTLFDSSLSLSNLLGDLSILSSKNGQVLNQVYYSSNQGAAGDGSSLQIQNGNNWISSVPTPGFQNSLHPTSSSNQSEDITNSTYSAHYSSVPQSSRRSTPILGVGIGRDRVGAFGSPMEFKVDTNIDSNQYNTFTWNFGDGTQGGGNILSHTYKYPGDYVVILNSSFFGKGDSVSRINVKIVDPQFSISVADKDHIEIKNNSLYEVSLFGRALVHGDKFFVFYKDTIIGPNQSLSFGSDVTQIYPEESNQIFIAVLGDAEQSKFRAKIEEQKIKQINYIKEQITLLQRKINDVFSR